MKTALYLFLTFNMLLLFGGCKKKENFAIDLEVETPTFSDKTIRLEGQSSISLIFSSKFYLYNSEKPNENFAYADIIDVNNKLFIISQHSENNIQDHHKGYLTIAESMDDGETWSNFRPLVTGFEDAINVSAPSFVKISDKHIFIFYLVKYSTSRIDIYSQESFDGCTTWTNPQVVSRTNVGYQILNNARVQYINNRIIIPLSYPQSGDISNYSLSNNELKLFYYYSEDLGKTWNKSKALSANLSLLEPGLISLSNPAEWLMNIRTDNGKILFARTKDNGVTWKYENSDIISPSSPQTLLYDKERKAVFMVWNNTNVNAPSHGANRSPLTMGISYDNGYTWQKIRDIESKTSLYDYAYVALKKLDNRIYLVYNERNNKTGKFKVKICSFK
ncbi:sialidase family protein [Sphingobacterium sp. NGMCC 1.201703]|uniref:sialidase family protein n=1 Tax=Sphingobacterium sp. NGMCC 1.201703 TaxID=3388657 RepID=UPI0039FDBF3C